MYGAATTWEEKEGTKKAVVASLEEEVSRLRGAIVTLGAEKTCLEEEKRKIKEELSDLSAAVKQRQCELEQLKEDTCIIRKGLDERKNTLDQTAADLARWKCDLTREAAYLDSLRECIRLPPAHALSYPGTQARYPTGSWKDPVRQGYPQPLDEDGHSVRQGYTQPLLEDGRSVRQGYPQPLFEDGRSVRQGYTQPLLEDGHSVRQGYTRPLLEDGRSVRQGYTQPWVENGHWAPSSEMGGRRVDQTVGTSYPLPEQQHQRHTSPVCSTSVKARQDLQDDLLLAKRIQTEEDGITAARLLQEDELKREQTEADLLYALKIEEEENKGRAELNDLSAPPVVGNATDEINDLSRV